MITKKPQTYKNWAKILNTTYRGKLKVPNPKRKHTPHRRDCRRSANSKLYAANSSKCSNCSVAKLPHKVCLTCGFYNGRLVLPKKIKESLEFEGKGAREK
jgi:large subunit ribosomal protein L32